MEGEYAYEEQQNDSILQQIRPGRGMRAGITVGKPGCAALVEIAGANPENRQRGEHRREADRVEDRGNPAARHQRHRGQRRRDVARMIPSLVQAHGAVEERVPHQPECERGQQRTQKRLCDTGDEKQGVDVGYAAGSGGNQREQQARDQRRAGEKRAAVRNAVGDDPGGRLEQQRAEPGQRGGRANRAVTPTGLLQVKPAELPRPFRPERNWPRSAPRGCAC